jgi:hypothetical protein
MLLQHIYSYLKATAAFITDTKALIRVFFSLLALHYIAQRWDLPVFCPVESLLDIVNIPDGIMVNPTTTVHCCNFLAFNLIQKAIKVL